MGQSNLGRAINKAAVGLGLAAGLLTASNPAWAEGGSALKLSGAYRADIAGTLSGGLAKRGRVLDDLQIFGDLDLERAVGWKNATAHFQLLDNSGGRPNEDTGSLQGVDNIEVARQRARLFEAWVEQSFGEKASMRAGLYDLNSEFYANESAGLLLAPAFGIGSELAATGPNGPSIFPSTALAARLRVTPNPHVYAQAVALNAHAGVLGDPGGVETSFDNGLLLVAEAGWTGNGKIAAGVWRYTRKQDDLRLTTPDGDPAPATAQGAYLLLERALTRGDRNAPRHATAFARLGLSDGDTTAFHGGWQAGVLVKRVFAGRPDSAFSIGLNQALLSRKYRDNALDDGRRLSGSERAIEVAYADKIGPVTIQPDLQYVKDPGGDRALGHALVAAVRFGVAF